MALSKSQKSLKSWTKQKWRTKSGKPSTQGPKATGERYLPSAAIKSLSASEYAATSRAKRKGTKAGKQHVAQPKKIAKKTKSFRAAKGGLAQQAAIAISMKKRGVKPKGKKEVMAKAKDPKVGTGKKPKGSGRRLYTDENPKDTVSIKFATVADAKATIAKVKRIKKPYARKIQILTVAEQRAKVMGKTAIANLFKQAKAELRRKHNAVSNK